MRAAWEEADRWFWDEYHRPGNDTWADDGRIEDYWRRYHTVMLGRIGLEAQREMLDRILASQFATGLLGAVSRRRADAEREVRGIGGIAHRRRQ